MCVRKVRDARAAAAASGGITAAAAAAAAAAPSPDDAATQRQVTATEVLQTSCYIIFNTATFATALALVLLLLLVRRAPQAKRAMDSITVLLSLNALFVASAFALAVFPGWRRTWPILVLITGVSLGAIYIAGRRVRLLPRRLQDGLQHAA
ncbi:hypothetical protein ACP4OV_002496 [Aristida adscensionis]